MFNFKLFDVHTHIQFAAFEKDYKEVIERALKQDIALVNIGTQKDTSLKAVEIAENYESGVYAVVGLHPIHTENSYHDAAEIGSVTGGFTPLEISHPKAAVVVPKGQGGFLTGFMSRAEEFDYDFYKKLAVSQKVLAIGECGLDYYRIKNEDLKFKNKQKDVFIKQIELASEIKKPLMIHCRSAVAERASPQNEAGRSAFDDLIAILNSKSYILNSSSGIIHFFSGTKEDAQELLNFGFSFSFGGVITFARDYDEVIKYLPMENIVLETDAPYVAPVPYRGKRNEPSYIIEVAKKIAEIKNLSFAEVADITTKNASLIFNLPLL